MLELAILGLLGEQELHGYEIRKRLRDELGLFFNVSFGALYPALSRLERSGAVAAVSEERPRPAVPMTGSLSGEWAAMRGRRQPGTRGRRGRKVYRITDVGRAYFTEMLGSETGMGTDDARSFGLRLAFARHLPPQARVKLLERRRAQLGERLTEARIVTARQHDPYTKALVERTVESTERGIAWLDGLIAAERGATSGDERDSLLAPGAPGERGGHTGASGTAPPPTADERRTREEGVTR